MMKNVRRAKTFKKRITISSIFESKKNTHFPSVVNFQKSLFCCALKLSFSFFIWKRNDLHNIQLFLSEKLID